MDNPFILLDQKISYLLNIVSDLSTKIEAINTPSKDLLNIDEAAEFLTLAKPTLYTKCNRREIPHMKRGGRLYFSRKELKEYLYDGKVKTNDEVTESAEEWLKNQ